MNKVLTTVILLLLPITMIWADPSKYASGFVVRDIVFHGLQRVPLATAERYLPIKPGHWLSMAQTPGMIHALYRTGFFQTIHVARQGHTLVIDITEQPIIAQLSISGNSVVPTDKLKTVLNTLGVATGYIYQPVKVSVVEQSLLNQYYQLGYYNASVKFTVDALDPHRVALKLSISEGVIARIRQITVLGQRVFTEAVLLKAMQIDTTGWFTFITKKDRYAEDKVTQGLENLRNFYFNHGYVHFNVLSAQTMMSPDRKSMSIVVTVTEGKPYTVARCSFAGELLIPPETLQSLVGIVPGEVFSRQKVMDGEQAIRKRLADAGYLFATIQVESQLDDSAATLSLVFVIHPGKRTYVHTINFMGNHRTNDRVLRRELVQMEAAPAVQQALDASRHRLQLLPYIREVTMDVAPVPQHEDQVDVNYHVSEDSAAQASLHIGYSQLYRTILGASLMHQNFFGTGNTVGLNISHSRYEQFYSFDFSNPYYTPEGVSRAFSLSISRVDPRGGGIDNAYTTYEYNASVLYGIPIGEQAEGSNRLLVGAGYQNTLVKLANSGISEQVNDFIHRHGRRFHEFDMKLGWVRNRLDKAIFPTQGTMQTVALDYFAPLAQRSLSFYTVTYQVKDYLPLNDQFIVLSRLDLGYGNSWQGSQNFPFFRNFYAGGLDSVRGYQGNTLGPRDSNGKPLGGNVLVDGSIGMIVPNHFSDNLRTSLFLDAGNVYSTDSHHHFGGQSRGAGSLRYSAGVQADWLTPVGPVSVSLAMPLHSHHGDYHEAFQFALGAKF